MLRQLLFPDIVPAEQIVLDAVKVLLEPLMKTMPDVVEATMPALQGGRTPAKAGQALAGAILAHEKMMLDKERSSHSVDEKELADLETKLALQAREINQLKINLAKEEQEGLRKDNLMDGYQETIESQNRLLAEQHKKLSSLFQ